MSEKKVVSIDSTILNTLQLCARKCFYSFELHLQQPDKAEPLERGDLLHKMLELYYGMNFATTKLNDRTWIAKPDNDTVVQCIEAGLFQYGEDHSPWERRVKMSVECGRFFATKMALEINDVEEIIFQFGEYTKFYRYDKWEPLAVEEVGTKILYEDDEIILVYNFKIDLIMSNGSIIAPFDHKTSKKRQHPSSLSNQFTGYAYGLDKMHVIVNKIGFQKTLKPSERFQRDLLTYDATRISEWVQNTVEWQFDFMDHRERGVWPMNFTSCDKYSGCHFSKLCEKSAEAREWIMERDFVKGKAWDVASILEGKTNNDIYASLKGQED